MKYSLIHRRVIAQDGAPLAKIESHVSLRKPQPPQGFNIDSFAAHLVLLLNGADGSVREPQISGSPGALTAEKAALHTRAELEEMSVIQMAAGIDIEMEPIPERAADPFCAKAKERRAYTRRLARAAFQLIPNFALNMKQDAAVAGAEQGTRSVEPLPPSARERRMEAPAPDPEVMRDYIVKLTAYYMDNPGWTELANEARGYVAALSSPSGRGDE